MTFPSSQGGERGPAIHMRILVLNGPNLDLLGRREVALYGVDSLAGICLDLDRFAAGIGVELEHVQSASESELLRVVANAGAAFDGVVFNPGGFTHTSVALLDAVLACSVPVVEVHITNTLARDPVRRVSHVGRGVMARIEGFGATGYRLAILGIIELLKQGGGTES